MVDEQEWVADKQNVVEVDYWTSRWDEKEIIRYRRPPLWHDLVKRYLPKRKDWTLFEIGCVPGGLLVYFNKEFGYRPAGIDYCPRLDMVRATLEMNGCDAAEDLFQGDLFEFTPPRQYDVVFSAGFVEHFEDYMPALRKHVECVRPGGLLLITVPNYTHIQYAIRKVFDGPNLAKHRFEIMKPKVLRRAVEECAMEVLHCANAATFDYWVVLRGTGLKRTLTWFCEGVAGKIADALRATGLGQIPSRWFSPFTVCISRKPESAAEPVW